MDKQLKEIEKRFWSKVDTKGSDDCWEWKASINSGGYGTFNWFGDVIGAHQVSWILINGSIPKDKWILHKCGNRRCTNPDHLYAGTPSDNMNDRAIKNSENQGWGQGKLREGEIWLIRRLKVLKSQGIVKRYRFSERLVAKMFKVNHCTIHSIWGSDKFLCSEGRYI
uniref:Putative homing endonuclease n=1 Tax=viral metagenome TaxID=1070528 RepID=A0A6M3K4F7_9ZZZZ